VSTKFAIYVFIEDAIEVTKSNESKNGQKVQWQKQKVQTMIYKTLHIKLKIRKNKLNKLTGVNTGGSCSTSGTCPVLLLRLKITKSQN
jgi:hypothetical protein